MRLNVHWLLPVYPVPLMKLNARWALPVYPVFRDEKSNASDEKSVKQKNRKTSRTSVVARNFV